MGRPPGKIQDRPIQMRASAEFLKSIDKWRTKQPDKPPRAQAIRQLVVLGIASTAQARRKKTAHDNTVESTKIAGRQIDRMGNDAATSKERASRKRRLLQGPKEFRQMRDDLRKKKR